MHLTKAEAKKITGVAPRKVNYCLWSDGTKGGTRTACELLHVIECESEDAAKAQVQKIYKDGREVVHKPRCLYPHLQYEYYQREGVFVPTVIVYNSEKISWKSLFGYFISRWSLDYKSHSGSNIQGKLNCNFYSIYELDSEEPLFDTWLCSDIERIYSKYAPKSA